MIDFWGDRGFSVGVRPDGSDVILRKKEVQVKSGDAIAVVFNFDVIRVWWRTDECDEALKKLMAWGTDALPPEFDEGHPLAPPKVPGSLCVPRIIPKELQGKSLRGLRTITDIVIRAAA